MEKNNYNFIPILVPTNRREAPICKMNNGKLCANTNASSRWALYDLFIISDRPITTDSQLAFSATMQIVKITQNTSADFLVIEACTNSNLNILNIEQDFIKSFIDCFNKRKPIFEVKFIVVENHIKITKIKKNESSWLRTNKF